MNVVMTLVTILLDHDTKPSFILEFIEDLMDEVGEERGFDLMEEAEAWLINEIREEYAARRRPTPVYLRALKRIRLGLYGCSTKSPKRDAADPTWGWVRRRGQRAEGNARRRLVWRNILLAAYQAYSAEALYTYEETGSDRIDEKRDRCLKLLDKYFPHHGVSKSWANDDDLVGNFRP